MRALPFLLSVVVALVVACSGGSGPSLDANNYDLHCVGNTDCVLIGTATGCECPLCNNRAINLTDQQQYDKDLAAYRAACVATPCSNITCPTVTAYCDGTGHCQVQ